MKHVGRLAVLGVVFGLSSQSCGSSDDKKTVQKGDDAGGEGGEAASAVGGGGQGTSVPEGGRGGAEGDPLEAAGAAGQSTEPTSCPAGFGDCDDDPSECEQSLNELENCGACGVTCTNPHGESVCEGEACAVTCDPGYGDCNGDTSDGCETALVDNDEHCGACGRDCTSAGATCMMDSCGDIRMQDNVSLGIGNGPFNDHAFAFSPELGIAAITRTNTVVQLFPLDGSAGKVLWNAGSSSTDALVIDGQEVYWAQFGTPSLVRKKLASATPSETPVDVFATDSVPVYLRKQGNYLYWITGDYAQTSYVYRRAMDALSTDKGTQIVTVSQGNTTSASHLRGFAVTTDAIYWQTMDDANAATTDGDIRTVPLAGGTPTSVPPVPLAPDGVISDGGNAIIPPSLTAVGDTLYFARTIGNSPLNGVYSYKQGDAAPKKLAEAENVTTLAVGESFVYYGLLNQQGVWRAPIDGGQGVMVGKSYQSVIVGTDDKFAYVAFVNRPSYFYKIFH